jgi:hypothetical protein
MLKSLLIVAAALVTSTAAIAYDSPDVRLQKVLEGRVAGQPVRCLPLSRVSSSEIIDGKAIIYRVGSKLYVNEPRSGAESLRRDDIAVTRVLNGQLCSIDPVNLVDRASRFWHGFVTLGEFVPYTKPKAG